MSRTLNRREAETFRKRKKETSAKNAPRCSCGPLNMQTHREEETTINLAVPVTDRLPGLAPQIVIIEYARHVPVTPGRRPLDDCA